MTTSQKAEVKAIDQDTVKNLPTCRICFDPITKKDPGIRPCYCNAEVHFDCQRQWLETTKYKSCEVCRYSFQYQTQWQWIGCWQAIKNLFTTNRAFCLGFWMFWYLLTPILWDFRLIFNIYWLTLPEEQLPFQPGPFTSYLVWSSLGFGLLLTAVYLTTAMFIAIDLELFDKPENFKWNHFRASWLVLYNLATHMLGLMVIYGIFIPLGLVRDHIAFHSLSYGTWFLGNQLVFCLLVAITLVTLPIGIIPYCLYRWYQAAYWGSKKILQTIPAEDLTNSNSDSDSPPVAQDQSDLSSSSHSLSSSTDSGSSPDLIAPINNIPQFCRTCHQTVQALTPDQQFCQCQIPVKHFDCLNKDIQSDHYLTYCTRCNYSYQIDTIPIKYNRQQAIRRAFSHQITMTTFYTLGFILSVNFWNYKLAFGINWLTQSNLFYSLIPNEGLQIALGIVSHVLILGILILLIMPGIGWLADQFPNKLPEPGGQIDRELNLRKTHLRCGLPIIYNLTSNLLGLIFLQVCLVPIGAIRNHSDLMQMSFFTWIIGQWLVVGLIVVAAICLGLPLVCVLAFRGTFCQKTQLLAPIPMANIPPTQTTNDHKV